MEDLIIGVGNYGRRTRVPKGPEPDPNEPHVLVTRTLVIKHLVPLSQYTTDGRCASVQEAREYELELPEEEQVMAVVEAVANANGPTQQLEFSVRVDEAAPGFRFGDE